MTLRRERVHGHMGELLQGRLGPSGPVVLVTLPCPGLWLEVSREDGPFAVEPDLAQIVDSARLRALLRVLDAPVTGRFSAQIAMPVGAGAGASTAALLAVARLVAPDLGTLQTETLCHQLEGASDPLLRPNAERLLWASRQAKAVAQLENPPPLVAVGGFHGAARRTDPKDLNFPDISDLIAAWPMACSSPLAFADLVTQSAKRTLDRRGGDARALRTLAERLGAIGFAIAHTGSACAFLYPPEHRAEPTLAALADLGWRHLQTQRLGGAD